MEWTAYTYNGTPILHAYGSDVYQWEDVPDRIAFVDVFLPDGSVRRLQGMDLYFVDAERYRYGMQNSPENADIYEGRQSIAYEYTTHESEREAPISAIWRAGVMLSDEHAREVGLL